MEVSNEVLLEDIHNTGLEVDAYYNLAQGFLVLSRLPENEGAQSTIYLHEHYKYSDLEQRCRAFFNKLMQLKSDRGIQDPESEL